MCRCFQQRIALQQWTYEWRPAGEIVIYPRSFSMFGEPVVTSDVLGSPTRNETTECRRNGVKEVRRVIGDSIRLLMNHLSTNSLCGIREPRAIGRKRLRCPLVDRILALVRLSLHYLDSFAIPRLLHLHRRAVLHPRQAGQQQL